MNLYAKYMDIDSDKVSKLGTVELEFTDSGHRTLLDSFVVGEFIFGLTKARRKGKYIAHKYMYNLQVSSLRAIYENFDPNHWRCTSDN